MSESNGAAVTNAPNELHLKYRPRSFDEVVGQDAAVRMLCGKAKTGKLPRSVMFVGPSGVGKTSLARVLAAAVGCDVTCASDYKEINSADFRGIDTVRDIRRWLPLKALSGTARVCLLDECHKLSGDAQNGLLKMVEEPPTNRYFLFCTTDPERVIATLRKRCSVVKLDEVGSAEIAELVGRVAEREGKAVDAEAVKRIARVAEGSVRDALVVLEQVIDLPEGEQAAAVTDPLSRQNAVKIAQTLLFDYRDQERAWATLQKVLLDVEAEEPEGLRHMVLSYCRSVMLAKGGKRTPYKTVCRAFNVAGCFERNYWDSKKAGLTLSCFEALMKE